MQDRRAGTSDKGAMGQANEMVDQAREGVSQMADRAMSEAEPRLEDGRMRLAEGLQSVAQAFKTSGQQLREGQHSQIAQFSEQAAERVERLSSYIQARDVRSMMSEAQEMARREPALFLGAAFTAGLLGARFLKSAQSSNPMPHQGPGSSSFGASYSPYATSASSRSSAEPTSDLDDADAMLNSTRSAAEEVR